MPWWLSHWLQTSKLSINRSCCGFLLGNCSFPVDSFSKKEVKCVFPRLLVTFVALLSTAAAVTSFDAPQRKLTIRLGRSPSGSGRQAKVTCYYFPKFMVKEVDLGEVGADRLAILPI